MSLQECSRFEVRSVACLILLCTAVESGCGAQRDESTAGRSTAEVAPRALNASPRIADFVLHAQNSMRLQTGGVVVSGGDIGARGSGTGPFLSGGVAIDLSTGVKAPTTRNVIADSVRLGTGVTVGDVQANRFVDGTGTHHGSVSALVPLPALPAAAPVAPGTTNVSVSTGGTSTISAGPYGDVTIGTGGKLRLGAGTYDVKSVSMSSGARLEALGAVVLHIQGRLSASTGGYIGAAAGVALRARDLRIEVSGLNGTTGALGATPPAAAVGTGATITALLLVPNGSFVAGTAISATGAFMARDLDFSGAGARITFQDGFAQGGGCAGAPDGTSCDDGNACTARDTCRAGACVGQDPVTCSAPDQCHEAGTCTPATGVCSPAPAKPDGSACDDGNACTQTDTCHAGQCVGGNPISCPSPDACHQSNSCDPRTGVCVAVPAADGFQCDDGDACTRTDTCQSGLCVGADPVVCVADQCHEAGECNQATGVCSHPQKPDGTACNDGDLCTRADLCEGGVCRGQDPVLCMADQCHVTGVCDPGSGQCPNVKKADGTTCDDGNELTIDDQCTGGVCTGTTCVGIRSLASGAWHTCAVRTDNSVWCWGNNSYGQLGDGSQTDRHWPTQLAGMDWSTVSTGYAQTCAIRTDGSLWCWGANSGGQLGDGTATDQALPKLVDQGPWSSVSTGYYHTCGIKGDGSLWCWGANFEGSLGVGDTNQRNAPARVGEDAWLAVRGGAAHTCAIRTDHVLRCWGGNWVGQLGDGTQQGSLTLTQGPNGAWASLGLGWFHSCGIRTDGTAWCWGSNGNGQIGNGTLDDAATPVQVPGSWISIEAGAYDTCAIDSDTQLWCWGMNWYGTLGNGNTDDQPTPVHAPLSAWNTVRPGFSHTCGITANGNLWCWGGNWNGQLGIGTNTLRELAPVLTGHLECGPQSTCGDGRRVWGEECDDGNRANGDGCDADCKIEKCFGVVCTAFDDCHDPGTCDPTSGACTNPGKPDGTPCDDHSLCTSNDVCQNATCGGTPIVTCTALDDCHDVGECDPGTGLCSNPNKGDGSACDDHDYCTWSESCQSGVCTGAYRIVCDPVDSCHEAGTCTPATGQCDAGPTKPDGTQCTDDNSCTKGDTCWSGACMPGDPVTCTALDKCHDVGICDPGTGECSNPTRICLASDQCHDPGTCELETGLCSNPAKPDGTTCDDRSVCTQSDTCQGGNCVGSNPVVCVPLDQCHDAGTCEPGAGCTNPFKPNGTHCDDGTLCTWGDSCRWGVCTGVSVTCAPPGQCQLGEGICQPATGKCVYIAKNDGEPCDDVNVCTTDDRCESGRCVGDLATCPNPTVVNDLASALSANYIGPNAPQKGVEPGTIVPKQAAALHGRVLTRGSAALAGVSVTVVGHPEFGQGISALDGAYTMVVNGGGDYVVRLAKTGYLPADRRAHADWQLRSSVPDAVLIEQDPTPTPVDLGTASAAQLVEGSAETDNAGPRRARLFVPAGTGASLRLPNGTLAPVNHLTVHVTEYTVGDDGPAAMPAPLPPNSGYTYALEYRADESDQAGAESVVFNQPLVHYVENFLNFPVGGLVPVGYYDRGKATWVASDNGRIVALVGVVDGLADLDLDGSGLAADAAALAALGVSVEERQMLGAKYAVGQSLWRVPIPHFTAWDCNWPRVPTPGAEAPNQSLPEDETDVDDPTSCPGCVIELENQVLGENVPVVGTPFSLTYRSSRVLGGMRKRHLRIHVTGDRLPPGVLDVRVICSLPGRELLNETLAPALNLTRECEWDGHDATGQPVQGEQKVTIAIGYTYKALYAEPAEVARSFAQYSATGGPVSRDAQRETFTLWQTMTFSNWRQGSNPALGTWLAYGQRIGGWTPSIHHTYDPIGNTLHLGSGEKTSGQRAGYIVEQFYPGTALVDGDLLSTSSRWIGAGSDGSIYLLHGYLCDAADYDHNTCSTSGNTVWQITPNSSVRVAGNYDDLGSSGDGGPAVLAGVLASTGAIGPDGSIYLAGAGDLRRITPDGIIQTIAGRSRCGALSGLDGPASAACLGGFTSIAVDAIGNVFLYRAGFYSDAMILRIGTDGLLSVIGGKASGSGELYLEGVPATTARLDNDFWDIFNTRIGDSLNVGPDGSLYFAETYDFTSGRVRKIDTAGRLWTVAGTRQPVDFAYGEGGPAINAAVSRMNGLSVAKDGRLYLSQNCDGVSAHSGQYSALRMIDVDGTIRTIAGGGTAEWKTGRPNVAMGLSFAPGGRPVLAPDGTIVITARVRVGSGSKRGTFRIRPALPGFDGTEILLPSADGTEVYEFSPQGRHLATRDALTNAVRYSFSYTPSGLLTAITDMEGLATTFSRDGGGNVQAIVAPNGQATTLRIGEYGYLAKITNPAGEAHEFSYTQEGLMQTHKKPAAADLNVFTYDDHGHLMYDSEPGGASSTLTRTSEDGVTSGSLTSALGRMSSYTTTNLTTGGTWRTSTGPDGLTTLSEALPDGTTTTTFPNGETMSVKNGPDPRFGMQVPVAESTVLRTPGGIEMNIQESRTATEDHAGNLVTQVNTRTVNNKTTTSTYDAVSRTMISVSPAGRQTSTTLDEKGRVVQVQPASLALTAYSYDTRGRLEAVTVGTGSTARVTTFGYDPLDRVSTVTDPLQRVQSFAYDDANRVTSQTFTDGNQVAFAYDSNGNVTSVTPPEQPAHAFGYTPADLMSSYTPPTVQGGGGTTYEYNRDKQPTVIHRPDGSTINFTYDSAGRLWTTTYPKGPEASDGTVTVTRTYDPTTGKLASVSTSDGQTVSYGYDGRLLTSTTWSGNVAGSVGKAYNNDFLISSETVNGANTVAFGYDNDGLLTSEGSLGITRDPTNGLITDTTLGGVTDHRTYDSYGLVATYEAKVGTTSLYSVAYVRDSLGRIETKSETIQGSTVVWNYSYDSAGRLWQVMKDGVVTAAYLYDANGNRVSRATASGTEAAVYDAQDRILSYGKWAYTYALDGSLATKRDTSTGQVTAYSYDAVGNLRRIDFPDGRVVEHTIDPEDRRIAKKVNGVSVAKWLYRDETETSAEISSSGGVVHLVDDRFFVKDGATYRLIRDHLGSVRLVIETSSGVVAQRLDYDEFGRVVLDTNPGFQPFGFAGGHFDSDTGLVRFGARDYDAEIGRWTAKDPSLFAGGDPNVYAYVFSDPVNSVDTTGHAAAAAAGALVTSTGAIVAAGVGLICWAIPTCRNAVLDYLKDLFEPDPPPPSGDSCPRGPTTLEMGRGKGERGQTARPDGTDNPFKHMKPDPEDPSKVKFKDPHTGKTVTKAKPPGFDEYQKGNK